MKDTNNSDAAIQKKGIKENTLYDTYKDAMKKF